jgi:hypothetical protein
MRVGPVLPRRADCVTLVAPKIHGDEQVFARLAPPALGDHRFRQVMSTRLGSNRLGAFGSAGSTTRDRSRSACRSSVRRSSTVATCQRFDHSAREAAMSSGPGVTTTSMSVSARRARNSAKSPIKRAGGGVEPRQGDLTATEPSGQLERGVLNVADLTVQPMAFVNRDPRRGLHGGGMARVGENPDHQCGDVLVKIPLVDGDAATATVGNPWLTPVLTAHLAVAVWRQMRTGATGQCVRTRRSGPHPSTGTAQTRAGHACAMRTAPPAARTSPARSTARRPSCRPSALGM